MPLPALRFLPLSRDLEVSAFRCGHTDLDGFLIEDLKEYQEERPSVTHIAYISSDSRIIRVGDERPGPSGATREPAPASTLPDVEGLPAGRGRGGIAGPAGDDVAHEEFMTGASLGDCFMVLADIPQDDSPGMLIQIWDRTWIISEKICE